MTSSAASDAIICTSNRHRNAVNLVQETLSPEDYPELRRLLLSGAITRNQTRHWIEERHYDLPGWAISKFRAAVVSGFVVIHNQVDAAAEEVTVARRNGISGTHILAEGILLKYVQSEWEKLSNPETVSQEKDEKDQWTKRLMAMGKAFRILRDIRACNRDDRDRSSEKPDRARGKRKKTAEEERAEASEAGPELVARMRRILNL